MEKKWIWGIGIAILVILLIIFLNNKDNTKAPTNNNNTLIEENNTDKKDNNISNKKNINKEICPEVRSDGFNIKSDEYKCPEGQVMESTFTGAWNAFLECYTPPTDYKEFCDEETDCESNLCIANHEDASLANCGNGEVANCTEIVGKCGAGREEGGIFITKKNTIRRVYLD